MEVNPLVITYFTTYYTGAIFPLNVEIMFMAVLFTLMAQHFMSFTHGHAKGY